MKIMVINPNTSVEMTNHIREELEQIKREETELYVTCPERGPVSIESSYDEALAVPPMLELVKKANDEGYDAVIIACFSDPGLNAAKEISNILVVGIQEVSVRVATTLGHKFTILTMSRERIPHKENDVWRNKLQPYLGSVRELGMTVLETDEKPEETKKRILEVSRKAVEEDGSEVMVLGCAGMVGYAKQAEEELGIVVIDPTSVAFKYTEAMIEAGITHSKRALYAKPPEKLIK
ncbi:MAG: aspartate/glutamate racemase family protein [Spirochaetaceae bacterium]